MPKNDLTYKPKVAGRLLDLSASQLNRLANEAEIKVRTVAQGNIQVRTYTPHNLFDVAAYRQQKSKDSTPQRVIVVYTPKGGVGKTTLTSNMGCIFGLMGLQTLLIDLDFQSNLTLAFGYDSDLDEHDTKKLGITTEDIIKHNFADLIRDDSHKPSLLEVIKKPFGENGPHLIPADVNLDDLNSYLMVQRISQTTARKRSIAEWVNAAQLGKDPNADISQYHLIIFDASPQKSLTIEGALLAADYVIAPVSLDNFSRKGLSFLSDMLSQLREDYGRNPELILVPNFYDSRRLRVSKQISLLARDYGENLITQTIRQSEDFPKTLSHPDQNVPVVLAKPTAQAVEDLFIVVRALMERIKTTHHG